MGIECIYAALDDNRGTAPKSLVRLLEARIRLSEDVLWLHSIDVNASIAELKAQGISSITATSVAPALSSASKEASAEIPDTLCPDGQLDFEDDGEACYFGSSSGRVELWHSVEVATDEERLTSPDSRPSFPPNRYSQLFDSATEIPQELQDHLVSLYFDWEQPWFQLVDENLFRHSWQTKGRYFSPLLLNCILALGSRYSDRPEVRSCPEDPNTAGQIFLEAAEVLLHFDLKCPTITTIQSLARMAILYVATGSDPKGWLRHGMAIRLALDMGFNLDSSMLAQSRQLPAMEIKLRGQIYWSLYCNDKLWASYTGRVCTMLEREVPGPAFLLLKLKLSIESYLTQISELSINSQPPAPSLHGQRCLYDHEVQA